MALNDVRLRYFAKNPLAQKIDDAMKTGANPTPTFFMADVMDHDDMKNLKLTLMRLGSVAERRFGISGEVAVFYAPWGDFQRRSYNAIARDLVQISNNCQQVALGKVRFTPTTKLAIVVSNDPEAQAKVAEWTQEGVAGAVIVVLRAADLTDADANEVRTRLLREIRYRLGDRDLYQAQNPVTGEDFFGRAPLLRDLSSSVMADQNVAVFGLRRSGKTSVIRELKRSLLARDVVVTIVDMQLVTTSSLSKVAGSTIGSLLEDLRSAKASGSRVKLGSEADAFAYGASTADLADRIRKIASRNPWMRIVLAVDEVEHLVQMANEDAHGVRAYLGALRSSAQLSPNVSLMFSGVANQMFLSSSLGAGSTRVDNPMFGQVAATFMTPFSADETSDLVRGLGSPMFMQWSDDAIAAVHDATGGWPFFVRQLASAVRLSVENAGAHDFGDDVPISLGSVEDVLPVWRRGAARTWAETIQALELHYPEASYLLSPDVDGDSLNEWLKNDPEVQEAAQSLEDLGLLVRSIDGFAFSESLTALRALAGDRAPKRVAPVGEDDILSLASQPEGGRLEFKSSARVDIATGQKAKYIEDAIVKTVAAFLNTDGGDLLIGVSDSGSLMGIDLDLAAFDHSLDRLERWLLGDLLGRALGQATVTRAVTATFPRARGCILARVSVSRHNDVVLVNDSALYTRVGNQTRQLEGREFLDFVRTRE